MIISWLINKHISLLQLYELMTDMFKIEITAALLQPLCYSCSVTDALLQSRYYSHSDTAGLLQLL